MERYFQPICAVAAACLAAFASANECRAERARRATGHVLYAAPGVVYLDRGREAGLAEGAELELTRAGRPVARVEVTRALDHTALAVVRRSTKTPAVRDEFTFEAAPPSSEPAPARRLPPVPPVSGGDLPRVWGDALAAQPAAAVRFSPKPGREKETEFSGAADTDFAYRSAFSDSAFWGFEQNVWLSAEARDVWTEGLDFDLRAELVARYDGQPDRYLDGQRFIPLVRQASLAYGERAPGPAGTAGRFYPATRLAGVVDGGQAAWRSKQIDVAAFGGLRPSPDGLAPRADWQVFGASVLVRPVFEPAAVETKVAYMGEAGTAGVTRQAISLDNAVATGRRFWLHETATLDMLQSGGTRFGESGANFSDLSLNAGSRVSEKVAVEGGIRYENRRLLFEEAGGLPAEWHALADGRSAIRARIGAKIGPSGGDQLTPYVFGERDAYNGSSDVSIVAGGALYHFESLAGSRVAMDLGGDYGYGTQHQANLDAWVSAPLPGELRIGAGLHGLWTMDVGSYLNTFTYVPNLMLDWSPVEELHAWLFVSGGIGHHLSWAASETDAWFLGRTGVGYSW